MSNQSGALYVVATPIGNLADISRRALETLRSVDLIAAEDTRQTRRLLQEYGIQTRMMAYHEHNETQQAPRLAARIAAGLRLALVSDAGTPLVSDPGFRLVQAVRHLGLAVIPIPGPSALICALSASGLPSDRFLFVGFPPRGVEQRRALFQSLAAEPGTLIFYEAGQRVRETLLDLSEILGEARHTVLARELTKLHETFLTGGPGALAAHLAQEPIQTKGEHVLLVAGAESHAVRETDQAERLLRILLAELPLKQAAGLAARISGGRKNDLYRLALALTAEADDRGPAAR